MKYKLVIFDMDGTILNTIDDLADSCNVILEKYGFPLHTVEEIKYMVGNGIPKLIERALPENVDKETYDKVLKDYIDYYEKIAIGSDAMEVITSSRYIDVVFDYYIELIKIYEDMVNLLSSNPDGWYIEDDMVYLNTEELLNEYNDIVDRYNKLLKLLNNETSLKNDNNVSTNL